MELPGCRIDYHHGNGIGGIYNKRFEMKYLLCLDMDGHVSIIGRSDKPEFDTSGIDGYNWFIAIIIKSNENVPDKLPRHDKDKRGY